MHTKLPAAPQGGTNLSLNYGYQASAGQMGVGTTAGNAGQLMAINNNSTIGGVAASASYTYDNFGRLVTSNQTSNGSSAQRRFAYDRWGNRTGVWNASSGGTQIQSVSIQTVSFPGTGSAATNRIASVTSGSTLNYTHDANGNVTSDGVHSYSYDSENRVVSVDSGATASYAYDHQNRRYKTTVAGTVSHYVWQGDKVLAEHNGSTGTVLVNYIYAGSRMILSGPYYLLSDQLSVRLIMNTSGTVKGRQGHMPFGEDFAESGTQQEKHHFTSYERDSQTGTDYAVNRGYSFGVGRFQSADPSQQSNDASAPQSWNRYAYVTNAPIDFVDPPGLLRAEPLPGDPCGNTGGGGSNDEQPEPNPLGSCEIKLRFKPVNGSVGSIGFLHSYILTRALDGSRGWKNFSLYYGAHNELPQSQGWGRVRATGTIFGPGVPGGDFTDSYFYQILKVVAEPCSRYDAYFALYVKRTNGNDIQYDPLGDNSNRFVYTLLDKTGLLRTAFTEAEVQQTIGSLRRIPGWGKDLF